jgi:formamidopyrimidine-DNA glycosylase
VPELPEVEITARLIGAAVAGVTVESVLAPGINALKTFDPPLQAVVGQPLGPIRRRGKLFLVDVGDELTMVIHLMSAGRLQLWDKRAGLRDRTSRLLVRLDDGRELRLREFGTRQRAWIKLVRRGDLADEDSLAGLGPEAWPEPPAVPELLALLGQPRPLYALLRDQHVIAGIGRQWVDEILWTVLWDSAHGDDRAPGWRAGRLRGQAQSAAAGQAAPAPVGA